MGSVFLGGVLGGLLFAFTMIGCGCLVLIVLSRYLAKESGLFGCRCTMATLALEYGRYWVSTDFLLVSGISAGLAGWVRRWACVTGIPLFFLSFF